MKKALTLTALFIAMTLAPMAANAKAVNPMGLVYSDVTSPSDGYTAVSASRTGSATCTSYFGIVALGDCSLKAAMKRGGISSVAFYDMHLKNILGYQKVTVKAYGN